MGEPIEYSVCGVLCVHMTGNSFLVRKPAEHIGKTNLFVLPWFGTSMRISIARRLALMSNHLGSPRVHETRQRFLTSVSANALKSGRRQPMTSTSIATRPRNKREATAKTSHLSSNLNESPEPQSELNLRSICVLRAPRWFAIYKTTGWRFVFKKLTMAAIFRGWKQKYPMVARRRVVIA